MQVRKLRPYIRDIVSHSDLPCGVLHMLCDTDHPSSSQMAALPLSTASSVVDTSDALPMDTTTSAAAAAESTFVAASPRLQELLSLLYSHGKQCRTTARNFISLQQNQLQFCYYYHACCLQHLS